MKIRLMAGVVAIAGLTLAIVPSVRGQTPDDAPADLSIISVSRDVSPEKAAAPEPHEAEEVTPAIAEVIVTARRTAEKQQDVPIAMAALSAEDLEREKISTPQDLQGRVPSLVISSNSQMRNTETPTIRGQGAQFGSSPGVVIYFGEVALPSDPVANNQGGPGKFFDLSNLQILKGSQGTLFGRNTTGGALLLEPHKPETDFSASMKAGVSNYTGRSYEGVLNVPILEDTLLARVGAQYFKRDGFTRDVTDDRNYDSKNYWNGRIGLTWRPTERTNNYVLAYYTDSDDNGTATVIKRINREGINQAIPSAVGLGFLTQIPGLDVTQLANIGCSLINIYGPSTNCGQDILDEQAARGDRRVDLSANPQDKIRTGGVVNNFSYELSDEITLRNIASYSAFKHSYRWDLDGSRAQFNDFSNDSNVYEADLHTFTEEIQIQGSTADSALKYVSGAYYETTKSQGEINGTSLLLIDVFQKYSLKKWSAAPFLQVTYDLGAFTETLSGLSLTAGARYTYDHTEGKSAIRQSAKAPNQSPDTVGLAIADLSHAAETNDSAVTYTVGLDYKADTTLFYGKISRGYKAGGFSTVSVNPAHYTFEAEEVLNYEIGEKADFQVGDVPVRLNSALYYTDYSNLQASTADAYVDPDSPSPLPQLGQAILNAGSAYLYGFETDLTMQVARGLTLIGSYGYTKAKYTEFEYDYGGATSQKDCSGQERNRGDVLELSCVPYSAPRHQYSVSSRYQLPLDSKYGDVEVSATYAWTASRYSAQTSIPGDEPGARLPAFGVINASLLWNGILHSNLDLQIYGSNLANKKYQISNSNQWHLTYIQAEIYSEPRIVGLNLSYRWGT